MKFLFGSLLHHVKLYQSRTPVFSIWISESIFKAPRQSILCIKWMDFWIPLLSKGFLNLTSRSGAYSEDSFQLGHHPAQSRQSRVLGGCKLETDLTLGKFEQSGSSQVSNLRYHAWHQRLLPLHQSNDPWILSNYHQSYSFGSDLSENTTVDRVV